MSRKTIPITVDHLEHFPEPCRGCLFWELDPVRRGRLEPQERVGEKETWLSEVLREWGSCGRVAMVDDQQVGHMIYVPTPFAPGISTIPTAPASPDALVLTTAYVAPQWRGHGIGRLLVQGMVRDLVRRGEVRAVEAFAETRTNRLGHCMVPKGFLSSVGFKTQRAHPVHPRMRMDLRSALTWKDEVELALDRLLGVVRPNAAAPKAAPGGLPPARGGLS